MLTDAIILLRQELWITGILFALLFLKLGKERSNDRVLMLVNFLLFLNFLAGFFCQDAGTLFGGMFRTNELMVLEKNILNLGVWLISLQAHTWLRTHKHLIEFYILLLTSLLGMFFMISAGDLLMFYLGLEMSTIPLAAAANFDLHKRQSSEAAMKLIMSSAFASGLLLLGISFVYGATGTLAFTGLATHTGNDPFWVFSFILLLSGFAFKISAVPFHLWTADVFEGAPIAVTAFLSVISKSAVLMVLLSFLYTTFHAMADIWYNILFVMALLTIVIGNLFALRQDNLKRFLAFSSIAQVGFILLGMAGSSRSGSASVLYFILVYLFSNLAAFGVVALVSSLTGKEKISDYRSFYTHNPLLSWILTIALFSLAGVPPTAGFFGKFFLLMAGASKGSYWPITIAALNMVVSFYYYLKVVKAMFMDNHYEPIEELSIPLMPRISLYICIAGIIVTGVYSGVYHYIYTVSPIF